MSYCQTAQGHPFHGPYHDFEYGFPLHDEAQLFERLALEIMQAGLSWLTVLKKRRALREAFHQFDVDRVAALTPQEIDSLRNNPAIIRNQRKLQALQHNALVIQRFRASHGGFAAWLAQSHPLELVAWVRLFRDQGFRFVGPEIIGEFLMSIAYLRPPHDPDCPVFLRQIELSPPWLNSPPLDA